MEQNIEKFDPSKLMDGVRDRIKATFVSLIPDAQWEQMCDAEMKKFFEVQYEKDYNGRPKMDKPLPSEFSAIVTDLMKEKCKEFIKELISKPEYSISTIWKTNGGTGYSEETLEISAHLDNMIKEKMPDMLQIMFSKVMAEGFRQFFVQIQSTLQRY